jgi:hypothetical protein
MKYLDLIKDKPSSLLPMWLVIITSKYKLIKINNKKNNEISSIIRDLPEHNPKFSLIKNAQ